MSGEKAVEELMQGKKILITGASGQIGRALVHILAKRNEVHALARFSNPELLEEIKHKVEKVWRIDMGTEPATALPRDFDVLFHEAVSWGGDDNLEEQQKSFHLSCDFLADLMLRNENAVFVLGSTGSVYKMIEGTCKEEETPLEGGSTYVTAKIAMSRIARWLSVSFGRRVVELRYWYPFAPYVPHRKVDRYLSGDIIGNNPRIIEQRTYILHHIQKTILSAEHASSPPQVFNCATDELLTRGDLARIGAKITGAELTERAQSHGEQPGPDHIADTTRMVRFLGPSPITTEEGFRRYHRARQQNTLHPEDWMFE